MRISEVDRKIFRNAYLASEFLRRHRIAVILGAFVFWTGLLASAGFFQDIGDVSTGWQILGFFWMTVPMSFATYLMPRVLLKVVPLMNGYRHDEDKK